jgi:hypothetical protein
MSGDETRRFCSYCQKHVHNLDALSVSERLALLSSPAASICSRYKIAIRRPVKGKESSYYRHLAKCGVGVALTGSVLLVLWEMQGRTEREKFYRTAAYRGNVHAEMPNDLFHHHEAMVLGMPVLRDDLEAAKTNDAESNAPAQHLDLKLDPAEIDRLIDHSQFKQQTSGQSQPNTSGSR